MTLKDNCLLYFHDDKDNFTMMVLLGGVRLIISLVDGYTVE